MQIQIYTQHLFETKEQKNKKNCFETLYRCLNEAQKFRMKIAFFLELLAESSLGALVLVLHQKNV